MAISVPEGQGFGNLTFLLIMIALTPGGRGRRGPPPDRVDRRGAPVRGPRARSSLGDPRCSSGRWRPASSSHGHTSSGSLSVTPLLVAIALGARVARRVRCSSRRRRGSGSGRWRRATGPGRPEPPARAPGAAPDGWLRPGTLAGPARSSGRWPASSRSRSSSTSSRTSRGRWSRATSSSRAGPPGHTGQTLLDLTRQMYDYHNSLRAAHPASSPWWAWPIEPQAGLVLPGVARERDRGVDLRRRQPGHLVARHPGHGLRVLDGLPAPQPRARPHRDRLRGPVDPVGADRPRRLPVPLLHGAAVRGPGPGLLHGRAVARGVAPRLACWPGWPRPLAIVGPALLWILSRPLCAFVGVLSVNPGSQACPAVIPDFVRHGPDARPWPSSWASASWSSCGGSWPSIAQRAGGDGLGRGSRAAGVRDARAPARDRPGRGGRLIAASRPPGRAILTLTNVPVEPIAVIVADPARLPRPAGHRRPRRAPLRGRLRGRGVGWFVVLYPNISALPLPSQIVNAYQGILPTYLYAFQFPVSTGRSERGDARSSRPTWSS